MSSVAPNPSYVTLPDCKKPYPSICTFLDNRFPKVGYDVWLVRLQNGKITDDAGNIMTPDSQYQPNLRLRYHREVEVEPDIPFQENVLVQNEQFLVVDKPHFLPVTPAGPYVNQCLLYRLKERLGLDDLVPLHRIDRETAGLVMFSVKKETRRQYHELFSSGTAKKVYHAVGTLPTSALLQGKHVWQVRSRIVRGEPWFRVKNVEGPINAVSHITLLKTKDGLGVFRLEPLTGKQHQLRVHLALLGSQILYDRYYPELQPKRPDDFAKPLQLLAKELSFVDPLSRQTVKFHSNQQLRWESFQDNA